MFKFNFLPEDEHAPPPPPSDALVIDLAAASEVALQELILVLPAAVSYSPLRIPLSRIGGRHAPAPRSDDKGILTLVRRDLFDARFQLIAPSDQEEDGDDHVKVQRKLALDFIEAPSDLIPGVYEGGLKTWECSLDLVDYLDTSLSHDDGHPCWVQGKTVLEIGCGTAAPCLYLLHVLFSSVSLSTTSSSKEPTTFCLQDYNRPVLEFVTLPNIILTWYRSPLSSSYRAACLEETDNPTTVQDPAETVGELSITPELIQYFLTSLNQHNIQLKFFTGQWAGLPQLLRHSLGSSKPFDLVLTSETIYRTASLASLLNLLSFASTGLDGYTDHHQDDNAMDVEANPSSLTSDPLQQENRSVCLVAAKTVYFGVGGSIIEFVHNVKAKGGDVVDVMSRVDGIGRKVMRVIWPAQQ